MTFIRFLVFSSLSLSWTKQIVLVAMSFLLQVYSGMGWKVLFFCLALNDGLFFPPIDRSLQSSCRLTDIILTADVDCLLLGKRDMSPVGLCDVKAGLPGGSPCHMELVS